MEDTIKPLMSSCPHCRIMVGGAVLNESYAEMIGADFLSVKDARESVKVAQSIFGK